MTVFGPDGSRWQDGIHLTDADAQGIGFALWRASIGTRTDATFATFRDWFKAHLVPFSAYHFVYPTGRYPAAEQAATLASAVGDPSIPVMLDWESDGSLKPTFDDALRVADALRAIGYRVPLLYTGGWYWSSMGRPTLAGHGFDLVKSDYDTNPAGRPLDVYAQRGGDNDTDWSGLGGLDTRFLQFGSRVQWGDRLMDMNAFRGSAAELGGCFATWGTTPTGGTGVCTDCAPIDWAALGSAMQTPTKDALTPDGDRDLEYGETHDNVPWLQAVLSSMPKLAKDGGGPIFNPAWVGVDRLDDGIQRTRLFGNATRAALRYWQDANGLHNAKWGPTMERMAKVRGK